MKAVLISIKPRYCKLIVSGEKTVEIRKTKPELVPPFKVYIYETKGKLQRLSSIFYEYEGKGKVIGEFICKNIAKGNSQSGCCLSMQEINQYANGKEIFGWCISDLIIYDNPKDLTEFKKAGFLTEEDWLAALYPNTHCHYEAWAKKFDITRPPQSWCYVEELQGGE